jgi:aromatic ring-opening dioxygenase catalytic subunit (LigB family)
MDDFLRGMLVPPPPWGSDADRAGAAAPAGPRGVRALGDEVARFRPDVVVLASAQWVTTFHTYVAGSARLAGVGAPGVAPPVSYDFRGDPETARELVAAGMAARIPVVLTEEPVPPLDEATVVCLRDVAAGGRVGIVPISLCHLADFAETLRWGRAIRAAVRAGGKRTILAVSGTPCGRPLRGAERGPGRPDQGLDDRVVGLLSSGALTEFRGSLDELARAADAAPASRCLTLLLGALGSDCRPRPAGHPASLAHHPHPVPD